MFFSASIFSFYTRCCIYILMEAKFIEHKINQSMAFSPFTMLSIYSLYLVPKCWHLPQKETIPGKQALPSAPGILSLWIYQFGMFPISEIALHVTFRVWLLSLGMMFWRWVHIVARVRTSFLSMAECYSTACIRHSFSLHLLMDIWAVSTFGLLWVVLWTRVCVNTVF